jgi:hypothetical protein
LRTKPVTKFDGKELSEGHHAGPQWRHMDGAVHRRFARTSVFVLAGPREQRGCERRRLAANGGGGGGGGGSGAMGLDDRFRVDVGDQAAVL